MSALLQFTGTGRIRHHARRQLDGVRVAVQDTCSGLLVVSRHALLATGVATAAAALFLIARPEVRHDMETSTLGWLQARAQARFQANPANLATVIAQTLAEPLGITRATAADPAQLTRQQASVAHWLARRYRVAPEPLSRLVQEAWQIGKQTQIEPTLILAVMAIESGFNPFAQSPVGAQG